MDQPEITTLLERYGNGEATAAEVSRLMELLRAREDNPELEAYVLRLKDRLPAAHLPETDWERMWDEIHRQTQPGVAGVEPEVAPVRRIRFVRRLAAACIMAIVTSGGYFWYTHRTAGSMAIVQPSGDIAPGHSGAVLTLAGGQQIVLDSAGNGRIAVQGNSNIVKQGGSIRYDAAPVSAGSPLTYNTMTTARGRQFRLVLPDGSAVWLNAASSITYPTAFYGDAREVSIRGEAYFEIARNARQPFIVHSGSERVEVLGTRFDVMAYDNEPSLNTTLVEGSVKVSARGMDKVLRPGQQTLLSNGRLRVLTVDTAEAIAWVRGQLSMENIDIAGLMRQVSRWYDVDVELRGKMPDRHFFGMVDRNTAYLSGIIGVLEENGLNVTMEGRKIIVTAK